MKRLVILNPKSRRGAAEGEFVTQRAGLQRTFGDFDLYLTCGPGDATDKVRTVLRDGRVDQIIVAGGDGTINEAFSGYWTDGAVTNTTVPLGIINLGTGGDLYRTVSAISPDYTEALAVNRFRLVDAGMLTVNPGGTRHPFLNVASAGMGAAMLRSLKASFFQAGAAAYFYHTLKTLLRHRSRRVKVDYVDETGQVGCIETDLVNLFLCNGCGSGGGMVWAPGARLDDGLLRLTIITGKRKWPLIRHSGKLYNGRIGEFPGARLLAVREVTVQCADALGFEVDGEVLETPSSHRVMARYEVRPGEFPLVL